MHINAGLGIWFVYVKKLIIFSSLKLKCVGLEWNFNIQFPNPGCCFGPDPATNYYCVVTFTHWYIYFGWLVNLCYNFLLHQALDTFNTAVVSPIYYVMFTTLTIVASVIMFKVSFVMRRISFAITLLLYFSFYR